ncbi:MAG: hypothetical protein PV340_05235 [Wolbachia sp.]|nr:hypothetical protein [Wolbachia sp.]MDD9336077.1 hypothetical protein [Wolbachia sp.]
MSKAVKLILCLIILVVGFIFYIKEHYFSNSYIEESAEVDKEDFKILLNCPQHQEVVEEIYDKLDHQIIKCRFRIIQR